MGALTITHEKAFKFLSEGDLRRLVPAAFTETLAERASERYTPIPTSGIINDLKQFGWEPIGGTQMKTKLASNAGFQKHFINLRNPRLYIGGENSIEIIPELMIMNSYDARCSFKLYLLLYRVICGNGCVIASEQIEEMVIPHKQVINKEKDSNSRRVYDVTEWNDLIKTIDVNVKKAVVLMNKMKHKYLTPTQQKKFANDSFRAHAGDYMYKGDVESLLEPLRKEDEANNLFVLYNRIQEKFTRGGWIGSGGRAMKPLKNPDRELLMNRRLFEIAESHL